MRTAEFAIIGGGVMGASIASHLARGGARGIVVLDRGPRPGCGSTGRATGGFRVQFSTGVNVRLSLLSREKLLRFEEETGADPGFEQRGYLFLARSGPAMAALRDAQRVQHENGAAAPCMVGPADIRRLNDAVADDAVIGGAFCSEDGFIRPLEILRGYLEHGARCGVAFEWDTEVGALVRSGDRVTRLSTSRGDLEVGTVVNAAGAWAGALCGVPVTPLRRCVLPTTRTDALPATMPMTIWLDDGFHLRVRDGRVLLLWPDAAEPGFEATVPQAWIEQVARLARARVPRLRGIPLDPGSAWAGLYEMSPDRHAILGRSPELNNVYLANGSSGHGVMHSPAIGQLLSELILEGRASVDIRELSPSRFAEGRAIESSELL